MTFSPVRYRELRQNRLAAERLDVLEEACSVKRCHRLASISFSGPFGERGFCQAHARIWKVHYRIIRDILNC